MLTAAGKVTRALSFKTDFPYIEPRNVAGSPILTARIAVTDVTRCTVTDGNPMTYVLTISGADCISFPAVCHSIAFFTGAVGGAVQDSVIATLDETINSAPSSIVSTYTLTIA